MSEQVVILSPRFPPPPIDIFNVFSFQGSEKVRDIPLPEELVFTVDEKILNDVSQAKAQHLKAVWC